jgi:hypothetical protein
MNMKKGQSAMEYMTTYGWAILVIAIVLGVLVYLGVFSPHGRIPERCTLAQGISCGPLKIAAEGNAGKIYLASVGLTNNFPQRIKICAVECRTGSEPMNTPASCGSLGSSTYYFAAGQSITFSGSGIIISPLSNPDGSPYTGPVTHLNRNYCKNGEGEEAASGKAGDDMSANLFIYYAREGDVTGNMRVLKGDFATTMQPE